MDGLIILRQANQNNSLIGYMNINSLREKIVSLREVLSKASIDILYADERKLDAGFLTIRSKYQGINSHQLEEIVILTEERNSFCSRRFYCKTN